jgi:hypothetical protein
MLAILMAVSQESQKWAAEKNKVPNKPMQKLNKS